MIQKVMLLETTEGRLLCEFLSEKNIKACVCVTTSYGEQLLPSGENMEIRTGALDRAQMEEKLSSFRPQLVIDATHPYARLATENILRRLRVFKPSLYPCCVNPAGKKTGGKRCGGRRDRRT